MKQVKIPVITATQEIISCLAITFESLDFPEGHSANQLSTLRPDDVKQTFNSVV